MPPPVPGMLCTAAAWVNATTTSIVLSGLLQSYGAAEVAVLSTVCASMQARAWLAFAQASSLTEEQLLARQSALTALDGLTPEAKVCMHSAVWLQPETGMA